MGVSFRVVKSKTGGVTVIAGVPLNKTNIFNVPTKSFVLYL
jgi:hypothetical protein